MLFQLASQAYTEKSPNALPLTYGRIVRAKAIKLHSCEDLKINDFLAGITDCSKM